MALSALARLSLVVSQGGTLYRRPGKSRHRTPKREQLFLVYMEPAIMDKSDCPLDGFIARSESLPQPWSL